MTSEIDQQLNKEQEDDMASSSSFCSMSSSSSEELSDNEIDPGELEHSVQHNSRWGPEPEWNTVLEMMGGSILEFEELEGSFDGVRAVPPEPPLDAYVTTRELSPPRPPDYIKNFRQQREIIHPLI
ncbi:Receptor protein kinase-like protein [Perkinsela sp. CCAP 1560/4]|nr:Receptor protein kinase-like protein [Perkinsela sp. CCAP 1560/4]|eukprot:KNH07627.1 Receptor protein kinase-like protein [Perkinsela sp. CCAP 1560/4]